MKRLCALVLTITLILSTNVIAYAEQKQALEYVIYDEEGNFVNEGILLNNARGSWSGITLASGHSAVFHEGVKAVSNGSSITFSYTLSSSATMTSRIMKSTTLSGSGSVWSTTVKSTSSATIRKTADASAYYYPQITNSSTSYITITSATFN